MGKLNNNMIETLKKKIKTRLQYLIGKHFGNHDNIYYIIEVLGIYFFKGHEVEKEKATQELANFYYMREIGRFLLLFLHLIYIFRWITFMH